MKNMKKMFECRCDERKGVKPEEGVRTEMREDEKDAGRVKGGRLKLK